MSESSSHGRRRGSRPVDMAPLMRPRMAQPRFKDGDLLGSFDEDDRRQWSLEVQDPVDVQPRRRISSVSRRPLLQPGTGSMPYRGGNEPLHVTLPPRPTEMSADYDPPLRSPRRLSQTFAGPSSPPLLSNIGREIVFHPTQTVGVKHLDNARPTTSLPRQADPRKSVPSSPAQSSLLSTLASTTKLSARWKSVLDHVPANASLYPNAHHGDKSENDEDRPHTVPIDVTHNTPFATANLLAGSYSAPSGAPGFRDEADPRLREHDNYEEWSRIVLLGRRELTSPVLDARIADKIRHLLPPRQKLSGRWTLLFSLDQHGASLSNLYRLVDRYSEIHQGSANILIARDDKDNLFGVFLNEPIAKREGTYYGSGDSFLFRVDPAQSHITPFGWTGRNQYFALCEGNFISFGGGAGTYGLIFDSAFKSNSSATCPTFDNTVLCSPRMERDAKAQMFRLTGLEVWAP